ncbi:MAG TPA: enoyl-CoA hydratase-related protein, partial [Microcoleaceae cyanobacterium]
TLIGRPKSGTFRMADLVGLDTLLYVSEHLHAAVTNDPDRDMFKVPDLLRKLVETGSLGTKAGQGFYKKVDGEIRSLNPKTFAYESAKPLNLGNVDGIEKLSNLAERLQKLYHHKGRAGEFFRHSILATLAYSANRIPEIADRPVDIDQAMRWGFGWELGPFEIWDALGFDTVLTDLRKAGLAIPAWIDQMRQEGTTGFYQENGSAYVPGEYFVPLTAATDEIHLADIKANPKAVLWHNSEAALLDLGDGVVLYDLRSKANTLSIKVVDGLLEVMDWLETHDYRGMVIGNDGDNFCVGINLAEVGKIVQLENLNPFNRTHKVIAELLTKVQTLVQRIYYFHKPIVAAVHGRALGGGCELAMACPHVVADAETYIGLVELSVGLIPAGGGLMRMARWIGNRAVSDAPGDLLPFLKKVFETIGTAKVSNSAQEGIELGFLPPTTKIVMNADRRLYAAKQAVICLDHLGYTAPPRNPIPVLGQPARAALELMAYVMHQGGYISDYDRSLANRLAYVLTGGDLTAPATVDDAYLLGLERDNFLPLVDSPKTQERILHMLKTKKPLRN